MSELSVRVNNLSPNKQALLALRLDVQKQVQQSVVGNAGKRLVAYVVTVEGKQFTDKQLQDFVRARLPEYMSPHSFVRLDALPLSPNGKVDRKALKRPTDNSAEGDNTYVAPRTELEEELASIWKAVLRVERVGVEDNFFDLGGHSLLATQLISRIREAFFIELPLRSIFETPSVAGLATTIVQAQLDDAGKEILGELLSETDYLSDEAPKEESRG